MFTWSKWQLNNQSFWTRCFRDRLFCPSHESSQTPQTWFHIQIIAIWISVGIRDNMSLRVLERGSHYILHHIPFSCNCEEPFCLYLEYGFPITFFHSGLPSIWAEDRKKWCLWKIYWVQYRRNLKLDFSITLHFCITRRHNNTANREYWKVVHLKSCSLNM